MRGQIYSIFEKSTVGFQKNWYEDVFQVLEYLTQQGNKKSLPFEQGLKKVASISRWVVLVDPLPTHGWCLLKRLPVFSTGTEATIRKINDQADGHPDE